MASLLYVDEFGQEFYVNVDCGPSFPDIVDFIIKPVFLAAGFHPTTVNNYLGECVNDDEEEAGEVS